jgi:hypothetical protein
MTALPLRVSASARVRVHDTVRRISNELDRYAPRHKVAVKALAARHERIADLALSFPALLFALAVPRPHFDPEPVISGVIEGRKLAELSRQAAVPLWTRKLLPPAFDGPLPELPNGDLFRRRIANHLPKRAKHAALWLRHVANAALWANEALAVWIAREACRPGGNAMKDLRRVCLWAWFSQQPGCFAHDLITVRWSPDMTYKTAAQEAQSWHTRARPYLALGFGCIEDTWLAPGVYGDFEIRPLTYAGAVAKAAAELGNCAATYVGGVASNKRRLWVVMRDSRIVAMLDLFAIGGDEKHPSVIQLRGAKNDTVTYDIERAVRQWWLDQPRPAPARLMRTATAMPDRPAWTALWRPYWIAKARLPIWLPLSPCWDAYWDI